MGGISVVAQVALCCSVCGRVAACVAVCVPVTSVLQVFRDEGGVPALLRGLQPEVVGFSIYGAFSFGGTEFCRRWVAQVCGSMLRCVAVYCSVFRSTARFRLAALSFCRR